MKPSHRHQAFLDGWEAFRRIDRPSTKDAERVLALHRAWIEAEFGGAPGLLAAVRRDVEERMRRAAA
jgi:hypothetical protein